MPDKELDLNKLNKESEEIESKIDKLTKKGRGYGTMVERKIITPNIQELELDNFGINNVASIQDTLFNLRGKDKYSKYKINDLIYADLYSDTINRAEIEELMRNRLRRNVEYNYIINNMMELGTAMDQLADDVIFPNSAIKSGINIEFIGNNKEKPGERDEDLMKFFDPLLDITSSLRARRMYNFNMETVVRNLVVDLATYGYQLAATIPYKSIATDLLFRADQAKNQYQGRYDKVGESYYVDNDVKGFAEGLYDIYENNLNTNFVPRGEMLMNKITELSPHAEEINDIFHSLPYSTSDVDTVIHYLKESKDLYEDINTVGITSGGSLTDLINRGDTSKEDVAINTEEPNNSQLDNVNILEELRRKKNKKFLIDNIKGCTFEFLDINKVQPIFIKDQLIGVYVVDVITDNNKYRLGNSLSNILNASNLDDGINIGDTYKRKMRNVILKDVEGILRRNIDKTFLRNNPNLIEDIEWILDTEGLENLMSQKIRFIPAEYLTLFTIGKGPLGQSLLEKSRTYAMMHINLNKSDAMNKIYLEKPRVKMTITDNGNLDSQAVIAQAINNVRNQMPRLTDVGIPDIATQSIMAAYQTVIVHRNANDQEAVNIEQLPVVEIPDHSEYLRYLRNQATLPIGYPADLLDPSQNLDFAKKISNINANTLIKVISFQKQLTLPLSELATKRIKYMTGLNQIEAKVTFNLPKDINDNVTIEALDKVMRTYETYELVIDNNPELDDKEKEIMKAKLSKKLLSEYLDFEILDKLEKETIVEGGASL